MSTTVSYKGSTIATVENTTKTLLTQGKYLEANILVTDSGGGGGGVTQYDVTQTLTNVTSSTNATKATAGESFFCELTPAAGYVISTITVTMGGVDITSQVFKAGLGTKTITANDTYDAEDDDLSGYSSVTVNVPTGITPTGTKQILITSNGTTTEDVEIYEDAEITVNVPNSYAAGDEGKVVSGGALVAQTSDTVTTNNTYDTTLISSLTVNVASGGGAEDVTISDSGTVSSSLTAGNAYHFTGSLTSLTITLNPSATNVPYQFDFACGATVPTLTLPSTVVMPLTFVLKANTTYRVTISGTRGSFISWKTAYPSRYYIYDNGDEFIDFTGGYYHIGYARNGTVYSKEASYLRIDRTSTAKTALAGTFTTNGKVDLSKFTKLYVQYELSLGGGAGNAWVYFPQTVVESTTLETAFGADYANNRVQIASANGSGTVELNVASLTSTAFVSFNLDTWSNPLKPHLYIYSAYFA